MKFSSALAVALSAAVTFSMGCSDVTQPETLVVVPPAAGPPAPRAVSTYEGARMAATFSTRTARSCSRNCHSRSIQASTCRRTR